MIRVGSMVRVIGVPHNNNVHWMLPEEFIGRQGVVYDITGKYVVVTLAPDGNWNFPLDYTGILELVVLNKWNPMNYVPRGEPLKLP